MTIISTYSCNLCDAHINNSNGFGILFSGTAAKFSPLQDAKKHVCNRCVVSLFQMGREHETELIS
jgi:hypothetical protein